MFNWLRRLFRQKSTSLEHSKYESRQLEEITEFLNEHPNSSEIMIKLAKDLEERSLKERKGGSSSSPISSP